MAHFYWRWLLLALEGKIMECTKCHKQLPTWKMMKELQCNECGTKYTAQYFKLVWLFSIFVLGPVFKLFGYSLLVESFGEVTGYIITILSASLAIWLSFQLIVNYQVKLN